MNNVMLEHPCLNEKAHHTNMRIHLPVAPLCNIGCNYCKRDIKANTTHPFRPGVCSSVLSAEDAVKEAKILLQHKAVKVIGIAGPGESLYNEGTYQSIKLLQRDFPGIIYCLSTNGLLLPEKIDTLAQLNLSAITVTINTVNPDVGAQIYSFVKYRNKIYRGTKGASLLLEKQLEGIRLAVKAGIVVKINTVVIPGINDTDMRELAMVMKKEGASLMNLLPLIPLNKFAHLAPPSAQHLHQLRNQCTRIISVIKHCKNCRADAAGYLHQNTTLAQFPASGGLNE
ncbi:MAG: radical SAM protein [Spirochaetales bacterium]|nr:radical SAM protein [Spirochaetales bacterium]